MTCLALLLLILARAPGQQAVEHPVPIEYAGSQECATCHEDLSNAFKTNTHYSLEKSLKTAGQACESCHGAAKEHVESADIAKIRSFKTLPPQRSASFCLDCHQKENTHANRLFDIHSRKSFTCTSCHSVHNVAPRCAVLSKTGTDTCESCP